MRKEMGRESGWAMQKREEEREMDREAASKSRARHQSSKATSSHPRRKRSGYEEWIASSARPSRSLSPQSNTQSRCHHSNPLRFSPLLDRALSPKQQLDRRARSRDRSPRERTTRTSKAAVCAVFLHRARKPSNALVPLVQSVSLNGIAPLVRSSQRASAVIEPIAAISVRESSPEAIPIPLPTRSSLQLHLDSKAVHFCQENDTRRDDSFSDEP